MLAKLATDVVMFAEISTMLFRAAQLWLRMSLLLKGKLLVSLLLVLLAAPAVRVPGGLTPP